MCGHQTSSENPKPILSSPIHSEEHVSATRKISVSNYKYFTETSYRNLAYFLLKKIVWRGLPGMDFHDLPTFLVWIWRYTTNQYIRKIFRSYIKFQVHSYKEQSTIQAFKLWNLLTDVTFQTFTHMYNPILTLQYWMIKLREFLMLSSTMSSLISLNFVPQVSSVRQWKYLLNTCTYHLLFTKLPTIKQQTMTKQ